MDLCREKKVQQRDIQRCIKRQRHMGRQGDREEKDIKIDEPHWIGLEYAIIKWVIL